MTHVKMGSVCTPGVFVAALRADPPNLYLQSPSAIYGNIFIFWELGCGDLWVAIILPATGQISDKI